MSFSDRRQIQSTAKLEHRPEPHFPESLRLRQNLPVEGSEYSHNLACPLNRLCFHAILCQLLLPKID